MFGGENWTPNTNHPGLFKRAGINHWAVYGWDAKAKTGGFDGNFVDEVAHQLRQDAVRFALRRPC